MHTKKTTLVITKQTIVAKQKLAILSASKKIEVAPTDTTAANITNKQYLTMSAKYCQGEHPNKKRYVEQGLEITKTKRETTVPTKTPTKPNCSAHTTDTTRLIIA